MVDSIIGFIILFPIRIVAWVLAVMPGSWRIAIGRGLGTWIHAMGPRKDVVRMNLELAFPGEDSGSAALRAQLEKETYHHLVNLLIEVFFLLGPMKWFTENRVQVSGYSHLEKAIAKGKGVIFLASHLGNWEIMAAKGGMKLGEILMVTKRLKPSWFHQAVERGRLRCGVKATYEPRTFKAILSQLKKGGVVGIVLDQYAGPPIGIRVPFFGQPVGTHSVIAILAKRTGAAIIPVFCKRHSNGDHVVEVGPEIPWTEDAHASRELAINTAHYSSQIEQNIRSTPEQWLWLHRRFKGDLSPLKPTEWERFRIRSD